MVAKQMIKDGLRGVRIIDAEGAVYGPGDFKTLSAPDLRPKDDSLVERPPELRPMTEFDPSQPAFLHDRLTNEIEPWTGEEAELYRRRAIINPGGTVEWRDMLLDGWGNVLGG